MPFRRAPLCSRRDALRSTTPITGHWTARWYPWSWRTTSPASCRRPGNRRCVALLGRLRHVRSPGVKCIALTASMLAAQTTQRMYDRIVDGIASVLLTLKKRPVIRYSYTCVLVAAPRLQWRAYLPAQVRNGEAHRAGRAPPHLRAGAQPNRLRFNGCEAADARHVCRKPRCSIFGAETAQCCCWSSTDWMIPSRRFCRSGLTRCGSFRNPQHERAAPIVHAAQRRAFRKRACCD